MNTVSLELLQTLDKAKIGLVAGAKLGEKVMVAFSAIKAEWVWNDLRVTGAQGIAEFVLQSDDVIGGAPCRRVIVLEGAFGSGRLRWVVEVNGLDDSEAPATIEGTLLTQFVIEREVTCVH